MSRSQQNADYVSSSNTGMKNRIINGGMDISQRGTSFTPSQAGAQVYNVDRWATSAGNDGAVTVTQNSDVPSNNEFQNSLRLTVTTADTSIAAGQYQFFQQSIEGYNIRDLIGRTFTVSFWVRSTKTGIHCLSFCNFNSDRSYIVEYNITVADTWQYKTITVTGGLITAGIWNYTNNVGLYVRFAMAGGTTYQSTANSWLVGNFLNTANQVNCMDTVGNIFAITGVQLELGSQSTPFEHRMYGVELALCQRYFVALNKDNEANAILGSGICYTTTATSVFIPLPVVMRGTVSTPTFTAASDFHITGSGGASINGVSMIFYSVSRAAIEAQLTITGTTLPVNGATLMRTTLSGARIFCSAEL